MSDPATHAGALFLACLGSGIMVPVPEDIVLLVAGWQVLEGRLTPSGALSAAFAGTLLRDSIAFGAGRFAGPRIESLAARLLGAERILAARDRFDRSATRTVFFSRFAVGMRTAFYFVSGSARFPVRRFLALDILGLLITTPLLLGIGAWAGPGASEALTRALEHQRPVVAAVIVAALIAWGWRRKRRSGIAPQA